MSFLGYVVGVIITGIIILAILNYGKTEEEGRPNTSIGCLSIILMSLIWPIILMLFLGIAVVSVAVAMIIALLLIIVFIPLAVLYCIKAVIHDLLFTKKEIEK